MGGTSPGRADVRGGGAPDAAAAGGFVMEAACVRRVALVARDGLFFKDGRGWHTSASGRGHALDWPWPSTVLGALRAAWGRACEADTGEALEGEAWPRRTSGLRLAATLALRSPLPTHDGAWAEDRTWRVEDRVWPAPRDAVWLEGRARARRLDPAPNLGLPTLGRDDDPARESLWRAHLDEVEKPLPGARWWTEDQFADWLAGRPVTDHRPHRSLGPSRRLQVHVGIAGEQLTADDGVLFSHEVVETLDRGAEWALGVEVSLPEGRLPPTLTLGSDRRIVQAEPLDGAVFEPPARLMQAFRGGVPGLRLVAVTPSCFAQGWLPDGLLPQEGAIRGRLAGLDGEVVLRSALVPRPLHVSGWDMASRRPKATDRMVAPGAVYFLARTDGRPFGEVDALAMWLAALGRRTDEGFGRVVPGVWHPKGDAA